MFNEYMIIDASKDPKWSEYFTSWVKYHISVEAGPDRNDFVNWNQWFLPSAPYVEDEFVVSLDCDTCDTSAAVQKYSTESTHYQP